MKSIATRAVGSILCMFLLVGSALAGDISLTSDNAKRFAETIPGVTALSEELKENGDDQIFQDDFEIKRGEEFKPYSVGLPKLKEAYPAAYKDLNKLVKAHKFSDAMQWAAVGDKAMLAYAATKLPPEAAAMSSMMTPEMMAMLPDAQKAQFEKGMAIVEAVNSVSQADRDAIAPVVPLLDKAFAESGKIAFDGMKQ